MSVQNNPQKSATRLHFLDGLRGIAILLVGLYHSFAAWPRERHYRGVVNCEVFRADNKKADQAIAVV